jgi:uncharacterized membrane protein YcaP (DUF421 family)
LAPANVFFFSSWSALLRVVAVGVPLYAGLILFLRVSGKRTLSKMNAFDFVVTVALGSVLATTLLSKQSALVDGLAAFFLLIGLQYLITWLSVRSLRVRKLVKNQPRILAFRGEVDADAMRRERVTEEELAAAIRASGLPDVDATYAVILETDGSISVIPPHEDQETYGSLEHVAGVDERR